MNYRIRRKSNSFLSLLKWLTIPAIMIFSVGFCFLLWLFQQVGSELPKGEELEYQPALLTKVYARDGATVIGEFFLERRTLVPFSSIPKDLIQALIAAEDNRYYSHHGLDLFGIIRAFRENIKEGRITQGGSTITQQLARTLFLNRERTYTRKIKDAILALRLERKFSKNKILEMYCNQIYFGHGAYGVEAAAQLYFGKHINQLNLGECAMLAGLPAAPNRYSPVRNYEIAKKRQNHVLNRMLEEGFITAEKCQKEINKPIILADVNRNQEIASYFVEYLRQQLQEVYEGRHLYEGGYQIYTTLDVNLQKVAKEAVQRGLRELDKRHGFKPTQAINSERLINHFRTPIDNILVDYIYPAKISSVKEEEIVLEIGPYLAKMPKTGWTWTRKDNLKKLLHPGDIIEVKIDSIKNQKPPEITVSLEQEPEVEGSLISMDIRNGEILALVGGYDFSRSEFNRALQSRRQPGSAFKPIIYTAAMDSGFTPASIIIDSPVIMPGSQDDEKWKPSNYGDRFNGPTTLRDGLAHSRNLVTIKLLEQIGTSTAIKYAKLLGIKSPLDPYLSLALGSSGVSLMELLTAYATFPNHGMRVTPLFIKSVVDHKGTEVSSFKPQCLQVLNEDTAYLMVYLLKGVIEHGTGFKARSLNQPLGGKTGTTNEFNDAWFLGFSPDICAGVWVGYDQIKSLGNLETGAAAALPIWIDYMQEALKNYPIRDFDIPEGISFVNIDAETGLLASPKSVKIITEAFRKGTEPTEFSNASNLNPNEFLKADQEYEDHDLSSSDLQTKQEYPSEIELD